MDLTVFKAINGFSYHHDGFEDFMRLFALDAQYLFMALLAALFLVRGSWGSRNARHGVIAAGLAAAIGLGVAQVITHLWDRPRPYVAHPDVAHLFVAPSMDPSFPSDHATAAFAIAVSILLRSRRMGLLTVAMATVLAVSRVAVGAHYPADVLGGALLGTLVALLLWIPPVRRPLHALADWVGALYERIAAYVLRQPAPSLPG